MPGMPMTYLPLALMAGTNAGALKIKMALQRAYQRSFVIFGQMMEQWATNNVPVDLGTLISDFVSIVRSSPGMQAFVLGNNTPYASYVNAMRNVNWTLWGRNPAKDHYFTRATRFAERLIPLCIYRAIIAEGIPAKIGVSALQIKNTYFQSQF
jgi:hypothetical protein